MSPLAVVVPGLDVPEDAPQPLFEENLVPREVELSQPVALPFVDGDAQVDAPRLAVLRQLQVLDVRLAHRSPDVAAVAVVGHDRLGILFELAFLVRPPPRHPGKPPRLADLLHLPLEVAVAERPVTDEVDVPDHDLRALVHVEREPYQLRAARELLDRVAHLGEEEALGPEHHLQDALHPLDDRRVEEGVHPQDDAVVLEVEVDVLLLELLRALVGHDLDPLPLLHVEDDALADHAVRPGFVHDLDPEIVEEPGVPETGEVVEHDALDLLGVRRPAALRGKAHVARQLHVVQVGVVLDAGHVALGRKPQLQVPQQRRRPLRRQDRLPGPPRAAAERRRWRAAAGAAAPARLPPTPAGAPRRPSPRSRDQPCIWLLASSVPVSREDLARPRLAGRAPPAWTADGSQAARVRK